MKKILLVLSAILLFFFCGRNEKSHETHSHEAEKSEKVLLNDGKKWEANAETNQGIQKMKRLIDEHTIKGTGETGVLQQELETEFTNILQRCTMKGEAHEQLHNYLIPLKDDIDKLKQSPDTGTLNDIKAYLNTYEDYFQ